MIPLARGAFIFLFLVTTVAVANDEPLRIGTIVVRSLDVYSPHEAEHGWVYRSANALHFETRTSHVRELLLFHEGDPYDPSVLAESERNLRALGSLKAATIRALPPHDGVVDVEVVTQDSWSTEPAINFGSRGGTSTYGIELAESNLFGRGKELALIYDKGVDRTKTGFIYRDPSFIRPYWKAQFRYSDNSDGKEARIDLDRPFYSFLTPWATGFQLVDSTATTKLYRDSRTVSEFEQTHQSLTLDYGVALRSSMRAAHRVSAGVRLLEDQFAPQMATTTLPDDRQFRYLFAGYEYVQNDYLKLNFVNRDLRYEDINLGLAMSLRAGVSPATAGLERTTGMAEFAISHGTAIGTSGYVLPSLSLESRFDGGPANSILRSSIWYTHRFSSDLPQTFVSRVAFTRGWNLDQDVQFFADGMNGLRGYRVHAFEGDKTFILNLEHRVFLGRELFQLISPGAAFFIDVGDAAPRGEPLSFGRLKKDFGIGLRIGMPRTPRNLLRLDLAYALDPDPRGRDGLLVSVSSSQAF